MQMKGLILDATDARWRIQRGQTRIIGLQERSEQLIRGGRSETRTAP